MKKISNLTRIDLFDIIKTGFQTKEIDDEYIDSSYVKINDYGEYDIYMPFYGRCNELEFLSMLYSLKEMPSKDGRYDDAYDDIWQHTINNDDWSAFWFFTDDRFDLDYESDDECLLKFICMMIHPAVRLKNSPWVSYLKKFNEILSPDGYELYASNNISGRSVYNFKNKDSVEINNHEVISNYPLTMVGSGSYANVYTFTDLFFDTKYALKRAKKNLDGKELMRFRREYDRMKMMNSPYILKVYTFFEDKNEYVMEYMDMTLESYISQNNDKLTVNQRRTIIEQLICGYRYLHKKNMFHRDVSFNNILIKQYDDAIVVKISDFGLVKISDSNLTSASTEIKGSLNDPELKIDGFDNYELLDEIYALTLLFTYIFTGISNFSHVKIPCVYEFMKKGTNRDKNKRFQSLDELQNAAFECLESMKHYETIVNKQG